MLMVKKKVVSFGSIVDVNSSFSVEPIKDFRVNIIGFVQKGKKKMNLVCK